jgi:3-oxoacyl-ACP reductase-like protein
MGLLSNLMSKIFSHAPAPTVAAASTSAAPPKAGAQPAAAPAPASAAGAPAAKTPSAPGTAVQVVDVAIILDGLSAKNAEKLDWKRSIVDLMKLVGMDSSFGARKQLAKELNYTGDPNDSAAMNVWLHKQVLIKLSENGGKVPAELLD